MKKLTKCSECGCQTDSPLPEPRDNKQEIMVCVDCEYAISAVATYQSEQREEALCL